MPVRLYALLSLERMWSPKMASPVIRHNAAVVLGRRSATAATRRLIQALDDPAWHVRQQAARALGRLRFQAARGALVRASVDPRRAVRDAAQGALARMSCGGVKG
jgi:HEAT repeat protein